MAEPTPATSTFDQDFPKNYEHATVEPRWTASWEAQGLYRFDPESSAAKAGRVYAIDTPPPYVSAAHLHTGHAMSYSQAEFVIRYKRMRGHAVFYPMGFDDNGLPTERYVEQKYKIQKGKITRKDFIDLCLKETREGAEVYQQLWKSLGLSVDWRMTYSTIAPRAVKHAQRSFLDLVAKGRLERRADPILWCPTCATALAQADVEAGEEQNRPMHAVRFDIVTSAHLAGLPDHGIIETTRPELVTACVALACHPEDGRFKNLSGIHFQVPLTNLRPERLRADTDDGAVFGDGLLSAPGGEFRQVPLIFDESVDPEFGTGLMMVCTFGDPEDIAKWRTHKLDTQLILDAHGRMVTPNIPELNGKRVHVQEKGSAIYSEARAAAVELLRQYGHLLGIRDNASRASLHERCSTPVEIQVAPQWFIRVLDLKEPLLERGRALNWYPPFMRERYEQWVENLRWDWNISRQRFYGVPFPVWFCNGCETANFAELDEIPVDPLMQAAPRPCSACGSTDLRPEPDVMDTWMTSSLTPLINANWANWPQGALQGKSLECKENSGEFPDIRDQPRPALYPAGVRVQAHEIIRTWLFYTVVKSHLHTDSLPWRDVMISGWGLDRQGKKMSKRAGNFVDPAEVIGKYSADALRYWAAGATLGQDLRYLEDDVKGGKRLLTKLWNATRFAMQYVGTSLPTQAEEPTLADKWVRSELIEVIGQATQGFETYEYNRAVRAVERFFWDTWCDHYLEIIKERFRDGSRFNAGEVAAAQNTLVFGTYALLRVFAPILPFITEELYHKAIKPLLAQSPVSIHVAPWPAADDGQVDVLGGTIWPDAQEHGAVLRDLIGAVRAARTAGKIGGGRPLAMIYAQLPEAIVPLLPEVSRDWLAACRAEGVQLGALPDDLPAATLGELHVAIAVAELVEQA